jgi:vacuolar-type H+-ATPase subunit F/Vma7
MGTVAVLGEPALTRGYVIAGCHVLTADDAPAARRAFDSLPEDTSLVILTPAAAAALSGHRRVSSILTAVMPV